MERNPAIVVIGYNRPESLGRLLRSLKHAVYEKDNVPLIISLDYCDDMQIRADVRNIAEEFLWSHGSKRVISSDNRLGLRNHVLLCGDLTQEFGEIIVLEDDLYVSELFYIFALHSLKFYRDDPRIAGISLFSRINNLFTKKPFYPLVDGYDNYFLQLASSWGQIWTNNQWQSFREWYKRNNYVSQDDPLPDEMIRWPDTSWAKHYNKYIVAENKTFVYPRTSFSTNFCEIGAHYGIKTNIEQVPLVLSKPKLAFGSLDQSSSKYDIFFEIYPDIITEKQPELGKYNFEVDLNGIKTKEKIKRKYVLTHRSMVSGIKTYGCEMVPSEQNIIFDIEGDNISLIKKDDMTDTKQHEKDLARNRFDLFEMTYTGKEAIYFTIRKLKAVLKYRVRKIISLIRISTKASD